jgi:hypothetical protein
MQHRKEHLLKARRDLTLFIETMRFLWRFRAHPEALEPFLDSLRARGAPEVNVVALRSVFIAWRETYHGRESMYRIDRYLAAGMGAIDVVLLPVLLVLGVPDRPLFIALLSLAISLVLTGVALFITFVKRDVGIASYGKVHGTVISLGLLSGTAALTATFWHLSSLVGTLFLVLAVGAYLACAVYLVAVKMAVGYINLQAAFNEPAADASTSNESGEPHRSQAPVEERGEGEPHP